MSQLREILTRQLADHPIDFGMTDATAILEFLYTAYCESRENDPPETKSLFAQLGVYLEALPLDTNSEPAPSAPFLLQGWIAVPPPGVHCHPHHIEFLPTWFCWVGYFCAVLCYPHIHTPGHSIPKEPPPNLGRYLPYFQAYFQAYFQLILAQHTVP